MTRIARRGVMLLAGLFGGVLMAASAVAATVYVSTGGADSAACGTQGAPCRNPDYAVNKALSGDTVVVAAGVYGFANVTNQCSAVPIRSVICLVNKAVTIRGGYASSTWNFDPVANSTVIDGQTLYRGVFVYSSSSPGVRLTMANITIRNAWAKGLDDANVFGAGMNVENAAVTLDSVTFLNNKAIGADTSSGQGGSAVGSGLSIRSTRGGAVSYLTNVRFEGNSSVAGRGPAQGGAAFGALFIFASTVAIENSTFVSNTATAGSTTATGLFNGERPDALGGAIGIEAGSVVSLARVTATGNQVFGGAGIQYGGGAFGGAVFAESSTLTIEDSVFQSNVTLAGSSVSGGYAAGGGVLFFDSNGSITRTRIIANRATGGDSSAGFAGNAGGGGLNLWRNNLTLTLAPIPVTNTVIADNIVELGKGGNPGGGGGGLQVQGLTANLDHVTFARNQLGPGLVVGQAMVIVPVGSGSVVNLDHSVVADHVAFTTGSTALVVTDGNTLNLNRGAFSGNTHDINNNDNPMLAGTITGLASMTTVGSAGFVAAGSPNYNYHITAGSALRDAATGSTMTVDIDSQPRVDGSRDIGADEYVSATCVPGGATDTDGDGMPDAVEQKEGTHACAKDNDVFGSVRLFLMQQYRDFLGREADPDGLLAWMATMGAGTNADVVAKAFFDSTEYQGTVAPIARLYFAYFNRVPDQQGLAYWIGQYRSGVGLAAISDAFASSSEFQSRYGSLTNAQFVTLVYQNVLGRDPDPDGFAYWVGQLNSGTTTRGKMMLKFSRSPEYIQRSYNWVFVTLIYYGMLRRVPDPVGFQYWVAQLNAGASPLDLIDSFLHTAEYRARFLT